MIIFGISNSPRDGGAVTGSCDHCGHSSLRSLRLFRYFHLFFLPVIPLGSSRGVTCEHCLYTQVRGLAPHRREQVKTALRGLRRPLWHYVGGLVVASLAWYGHHTEQQQELLEIAAAAEPRAGDVWVIDTDSALPQAGYPYRFSAARINGTDPDGNVELLISEWSYLGAGGARKAARKALEQADESYFHLKVMFTVDELVKMQADDQLRSVSL